MSLHHANAIRFHRYLMKRVFEFDGIFFRFLLIYNNKSEVATGLPYVFHEETCSFQSEGFLVKEEECIRSSRLNVRNNFRVT